MSEQAAEAATPEATETPAERRAAVRVLRSKVDPNDPVCALLRRALALAADGKLEGAAIVCIAAEDSGESDWVDFAHAPDGNIHAIATGARQLDEVIRQSLYCADDED